MDLFGTKTSRRDFLGRAAQGGASLAATGATGVAPTGVAIPAKEIPRLSIEMAQQAAGLLKLLRGDSDDLISYQERWPVNFLDEAAKLETLGCPEGDQFAAAIREQFMSCRTALQQAKTDLSMRSWDAGHWVALVHPERLKGWKEYSGVTRVINYTGALPALNGSGFAEYALSMTPEELHTLQLPFMEATLAKAWKTCRLGVSSAGIDYRDTGLKGEFLSTLNYLRNPDCGNITSPYTVGEHLWERAHTKICVALEIQREAYFERLQLAGFDIPYQSRLIPSMPSSKELGELFKDAQIAGKELGTSLREYYEKNTRELLRRINADYIRAKTGVLIRGLGTNDHQVTEWLRQTSRNTLERLGTNPEQEFTPGELNRLLLEDLQKELQKEECSLPAELREPLSRGIITSNILSDNLALLAGTHSEQTLAARTSSLARDNPIVIEIEFSNGWAINLSWGAEGRPERTRLSRDELLSLFKDEFFLSTLPQILQTEEQTTIYHLHIPRYAATHDILTALYGGRLWGDPIPSEGALHVYMDQRAYFKKKLAVAND